MKKDTTEILELSNYAKQLDEVGCHMANLNYLKAITRCYYLKNQSTEALLQANEAEITHNLPDLKPHQTYQ